MNFAVWIVDHGPYARCFADVGDLLVAGLRRLGHAAQASIAQMPPRGGGRLIVLGAHHIGMLGTPRLSLPADTILYNLEQPAHHSFDTFVTSAFFARLPLWDMSLRSMQIARQARATTDGRCVHCRIGYAPELDHRQAAAPIAKDVDLLFYGSHSARRARLLSDLASAGMNVRRIFDCWGQQLDREIARARLVLNLHFFDRAVFEVVRCFYLLTNGAAVVSETGADADLEAPFRAGIAWAPYEGLVERCRELLADDEARRDLALQGQAAIRAVPMEAEIERALQETDA